MVKKTLYQVQKRSVCFIRVLLIKIKNDLIKFLLNLNIVLSNEEKSENVKKTKEIKSEKKLAEMKNALVDQEKNLNIVTAIFKI